MMKNPQTLVFVHIPKTAGFTLHGILDKQYGKVFTLGGLNQKASVEQFESLNISEQNSYDAIKGHFAFTLSQHIHSPILLTYLRNPVDRFLSSYYYVKRAIWNKSHKAVKKMSHISEFIPFAKEKGIDNAQTRHLSNFRHHIIHKDSTPINMDKEGTDMLEQAKDNLSKLDYVFHTHQFNTEPATFNWTVS